MILEHTIPLKSAHRWLSIAVALHGAMFYMPTLMLFYAFKGVGMGDFFLIEGIANLAVFLMEIPTGYIGDLCSRKKSLVIGMLCWIFGNLLWIFGYGFIFMLLGILITALAVAFISGTAEAYLYDLLKKRHKEAVFHRKYAKMQMLYSASMTIATLSGAFIYQFFGPTAPLWFSVVCLALATTILFLLPDVPEAKRIVAKDKSKWQDVLDISKFAMKHHEIKWLILFPALYGALTYIILFGLQSVMVARALPVFIFGVVATASSLLRTFWSGISGKILEKCHLSGVLMLSGIIIVLASFGACMAEYVPIWAVYPCLAFMALGSSSIALPKISASVLINHRIKSDERATVLSVASMVNRAFIGVVLICLKPLFDGIGVGLTFMIASLLLIPILICGWYVYKMKLTTQAGDNNDIG